MTIQSFVDVKEPFPPQPQRGGTMAQVEAYGLAWHPERGAEIRLKQTGRPLVEADPRYRS
jgi:hypothetical protein